MRRVLVRLGRLIHRRSRKGGPPSSAAIEANQRGIAAREAGDAESAIAAHLEATRVAPGWEAPWFNLGILYKHTGRWSECVEACQRTLEIDPKSEGAIWNMGIASTALAEWPTARAAWRRFGLWEAAETGPQRSAAGRNQLRGTRTQRTRPHRDELFLLTPC